MDAIKTGTIVIENGTVLPRSLVLATEPYSRGWTTVTNLRSDFVRDIDQAELDLLLPCWADPGDPSYLHSNPDRRELQTDCGGVDSWFVGQSGMATVFLNDHIPIPSPPMPPISSRG
jgi:hypothetical protein